MVQVQRRRRVLVDHADLCGSHPAVWARSYEIRKRSNGSERSTSIDGNRSYRSWSVRGVQYSYIVPVERDTFHFFSSFQNCIHPRFFWNKPREIWAVFLAVCKWGKGLRRLYFNPIPGIFFFIFFLKVFSQQLYYFQYNSGLWNTPYGKWHTSRTKPAYGKLIILDLNLYSPQSFVHYH